MKTPDFIKPFDIEKERENIIKEFKQKSGKLNYTPLIGDDYMTLIDIFLFRLKHFIELTNVAISKNYLLFSQGEYLDELVKLIGIKRNEEIRPIAELEIEVSSATFLSKGTKFTDGKGHFAFLLDEANITNKAVVKVEAGKYFKENYETTTLEIPNIYVKKISQKSPFSGFKAKESDDELKNRFLLALHRFSTAGSEKSYLFYVLSVEGITKANVYQLSAGVVQIVYYSEFENSLAQSKIKDALKDKIPLTDEVRIKPANRVNLDLEIQITPSQDFMFSEILTNVDLQIKDFFSKIQIGINPHFSQIIEVAFNENVKAVEIKTQLPKIDKDSILILKSLKIIKANR
ncbi:MAG: baseplate J/gp47 family protein [Campylobacter sp.]